MAKLLSNRKECVICAATGQILFKSDAVKAGKKWYGRGNEPKSTPSPSTSITSKAIDKKEDKDK